MLEISGIILLFLQKYCGLISLSFISLIVFCLYEEPRSKEDSRDALSYLRYFTFLTLETFVSCVIG